MRPSASVLVSTYNEPKYLDLCLLSLQRQTRSDFEVIVADDGSGLATAQFVELWRDSFRHPLKHVWQEHNGFGKTIILNKAVTAAVSDYLIFLDGDCLAHPAFVAGHLEAASPGRFLAGRCPRLSRKATERITREHVAKGKAQRMTLGKIMDGLFGKSKRMELGVCVRNGILCALLGRKKRNLQLFGGNFSCFRSDFLCVNGFDEDFAGHGGEDLDLGIRFRALGLQAFSVANRAVTFHMAHERPLEWTMDRALSRKTKLRNEFKEFYCGKGYAARSKEANVFFSGTGCDDVHSGGA